MLGDHRRDLAQATRGSTVPSSTGPAQHDTNARNVSPWRSSGMNGSGGAIWKAGNPPNASGASAMNSRYHCNTARASSSSKNIGPP